MHRPPRLILAAFSALALGVAGCGGASDSREVADAAPASGGSSAGGSLSLVAYSTPQVVYDDLIPAFNRTGAGAGVSFKTSFGASGDQSRAVEAGQEADVVSFSIEPDMTRLQEAGLVTEFEKVSTSVVSFIVRRGNPKGIRTWDDLVRPGVEVLTPNPFTSGAAKWNLLGAFAHGGLEFTAKLLRDHVKVQDKSGREALQNFTSGQGDVLLSYEYEGITAQKKGEDVDVVVPPDSVQIEILIAKTKDAGPAADAFIDFATGAEGQRFFDAWGYDPPAGIETEVQELKTIEQLGGWAKVDADLFDPRDGSIAKIESELGVPTSK